MGTETKITFTPRDDVKAWYVWGAAVATSFAVLETRAIRSKAKHATLSYVTRSYVRRSKTRRNIAATGMLGFATWFAYHISYEHLAANDFGPNDSFIVKVKRP